MNLNRQHCVVSEIGDQNYSFQLSLSFDLYISVLQRNRTGRNLLTKILVPHKLEILRAVGQASNSGAGTDSSVLRQNVFFLRETSVLLIKLFS